MIKHKKFDKFFSRGVSREQSFGFESIVHVSIGRGKIIVVLSHGKMKGLCCLRNVQGKQISETFE